MKLNYYVYVHYRNSDNTPFYIGKGKGHRAYAKTNRNSYWSKVVAKHGYYVKLIRINLSNNSALQLEKRLISLYKKRFKITNLTTGGEGIEGFKFSAESKLKMSKARKGRVFSQEYCANMSRIKKGIKRTPEAIEKGRLKILGKPRPQHVIRILQNANEKRKISVICLNTGNIFDSYRSAAIANNTSKASIYKCVKGLQKTTNGLQFKVHNMTGEK